MVLDQSIQVGGETDGGGSMHVFSLKTLATLLISSVREER